MQERIAFGKWDFDVSSGELSTDGQSKRLEPTIARLLAYFYAHQDRVISRDELIENVWQGRIVSDDPINRSVSILRQTLSPEDRHAFIKTLPKKGYRATFPPVLRSVESEVQTKDVDVPGSLKHKALLSRGFLLAAILACAFVVVLTWDMSNEHPQPIEKPRLAVLPFKDFTQSKNYEYLTQGVSDHLIHLLSGVDGIDVIARASSFRYKDRAVSIPTIADELKVDYIVEGSVQVANNKMRILARLVSVKTQAEVWSESFTRKSADIFAVQDEIASAVIISLNGLVFKNEDPYQPQFKTYETLLKGLEAANRMTLEGDALAVKMFEQAIADEPAYPAPYINLARALLRKVNTNPYLQIYPTDSQLSLLQEVERLAEKALNLNPLSSDAQALNALLLLYRGADDLAGNALNKAIELEPNNASALADYAFWLLRGGKIEEALHVARKAQALDPTSNYINQNLAQILWSNGRAEEATTVIYDNIRLNPDAANNYSLLARWSLQKGEPGQAMLHAVEEKNLNPNDPNALWGVCLMHYQLWRGQEGNRCAGQLLSDFPDYSEAKVWLHSDQLDVVIPILKQRVETFPQVVYYRLQLAEMYTLTGQFDSVLSLLKPFYPALFNEPPEIDDWSLWAIKLFAISLLELGQEERAEALLEAGLSHIQKSRKLLAGGFSSGTDDVSYLMLLGEHDRALDRLETAINNRWSFYSMLFPYELAYEPVRDRDRFRTLVQKQAAFMASQVDWYQARLDNNKRQTAR